MRILRLLITGAAAALLIQAQIGAPQAGWTVDANSVVRPVLGFGGNYWLGKAAAPGVIAAAFSQGGAVLKTAANIVMLDASGAPVMRASAPKGAAVLGISADGKTALAYFPSGARLVRYSGGRTAAIETGALAGDVVSAAVPDSAHALLITSVQGALWSTTLRVTDGAVASNLPLAGVAAPVLALADGTVLFERDGALMVRSARGTEDATPANFAVGSFFPMGNGWIGIVEKSGGRRFAWNPTQGREQLFQLPTEAK